ncbi:hypothetical protein [uncultured Duncaniella sp.]|uniref:hypothetical protein n=1 Tax=uncultured Duncaniella sp. TaxID=2768039 RepID=UPI00261585C5|nr:hypothetical protein [uncultured Duncaniella sp.]
MKDFCIQIVAVIASFFILTACSETDSPDLPDPMQQWSATAKGNGEVIGAYPDLYSNYWEYTYNISANDDRVLRFSGEFPHCRYFSFSIYNDETGSAIGGIDDLSIAPDEGSVNPFQVSTSQSGFFTMYVVPEKLSADFIRKFSPKNICVVKDDVRKVSIVVRQYLGTDASGVESDEYGGVSLPLITALNPVNGEAMPLPDHILSNVYKATSDVYILKSDELREMPFFLATPGRYYPNNSTDYLYARTRLRGDSVLTFSFIPAPIPQKPEMYPEAAARYWSVCLGSAGDTRSYYSLCDRNANWKEGEKAEFVVCLKTNPRLTEVSAKVERDIKDGRNVNLFVWDCDKLNIDGKPLGEYITFMYRNILPNPAWPHSISNMVPTEYYDGIHEPIETVVNPQKQIAHIALGDYGPFGIKMSAENYLTSDLE